MSNKELIELLKKQLELQEKKLKAQETRYQEQMATLINMFKETPKPDIKQIITAASTTPAFTAFDPTAELWTDYWACFETFTTANSIPEDKKSHVFLTNQTPSIYKLLSNLSSQQSPSKDIHSLTIKEIQDYMMDQFHPKRFVIRERHKFWSNISRKPNETITELAARIRQESVTCDFPSIKDPLNEALRTKFICAINNEAVLRAIFKQEDDELTFSKAVQLAIEVEEASKVAKETLQGFQVAHDIHKVEDKTKFFKSSPTKKQFACSRCGKEGHTASFCRHKNSTCHYCQKTGHLEAACLSRKHDMTKKKKKFVKTIQTVKEESFTDEIPPEVEVPIKLDDKHILDFEVDTGAGTNFLGYNNWKKLGQPNVKKTRHRYESVTKHKLPVLGSVKLKAQATHKSDAESRILNFTVTELNDLNLLGRDGISKLKIPMDKLMHGKQVHAVKPANDSLKKECLHLCKQFPDLFKEELGKLKDFELEVKFKSDAKPVFCKARPVPLAIQEDLVQGYTEGIKKGVWKKADLCSYGTPVVPVRKTALPGQKKQRLRICGDYSVTVNPQLETHRHPMPTPEQLMQKLSGGHYFTKIDLRDAYNQIPLGKESQIRLALSTHKVHFVTNVPSIWY